MFCPSCHGEYREGFKRCEDCGVELVARLPPEHHETPQFVTVFETHDLSAFLAARSALEGAGIPFLAPDELSVPGTSSGALDPAGRPGHLRVAVQYAAEARRVLATADD